MENCDRNNSQWETIAMWTFQWKFYDGFKCIMLTAKIAAMFSQVLNISSFMLEQFIYGIK